MKKSLILIFFLTTFGCQNKNSRSADNQKINLVDEKIYIKLGGEEQYVEMTGVSDQLPVLLFLHGGPGWPQTPHLRYFNSELAQNMIVVSWDQAGCGLSFYKNPNPKEISNTSLMKDAHELTLYLKKKFNKQKIFLLGFSYGSVFGLQLAAQYPEDYHAYIGLSQLVDAQENWDVSMQWLTQQAQLKQDTPVLDQLALIQQKDTSVCKTTMDCHMSRYWQLVKYNGAIYKPEMAKEIEKAEHYYEEYKEYDWFGGYYYTCSRIGDERFNTSLSHIKSIEVPVIFLAGRHDWNVPGVVAERYLNKLNAPYKEFIWFEDSGHEPAEEEAEKFNQVVSRVVQNHSH